VDCPEPEILPENFEAVQVFSACSTQWRQTFSGLRSGLDYSAVETLMRLYDVQDKPDVFQRIQILERALIEVDRERHAES